MKEARLLESKKRCDHEHMVAAVRRRSEIYNEPLDISHSIEACRKLAECRTAAKRGTKFSHGNLAEVLEPR